MKKTIALLLSLIMLLSCIAAFGDEVEEEPEDKSATYQLRNATGEPLVALAVTDNVTGAIDDLLPDGETLPEDEYVITMEFIAPDDDQLQNRYTLSFETESGYKAEYDKLNFENVLIDLLPSPGTDAVSGSTPVRFSQEMLQTGNYRIINSTGKTLTKIIITENATGESLVFEPMAEPGMEAYVVFTIDAGNKADHALTIDFSFDDGTKCSFGTLSIEDASLTRTEDSITGATPFVFGPIDAENK